ncbi:MAG: sulfotransferase [Actinomycetota bacterium]|nr:sulfotransferase [Actinomycetota bacterium]
MFFIVGSARSGTTLLRLILSAHPEVAVPPESRFITELYRTDEVEVDAFLSEIEGHKRFQVWELSVELVRAELTGRTTVRYGEAVEAAYRAYAKSRGKTHYGDKTPRYIEHIPLLAKLFPTAKFVHQIRDGRNVALSYADVPFGPNTVGKAAALWGLRVAMGLRDGRALGPDRYHEIRYEDFVKNAPEHTRKLCEFLGIGFTDQMLDHAERSRSDILPRAHLYNPNVSKPPTSNVRSWENQMPDKQVEMFEAVAGDILDATEYPRRYPQPSLTARVGAELSRLGLPVGRLESSRAR